MRRGILPRPTVADSDCRSCPNVFARSMVQIFAVLSKWRSLSYTGMFSLGFVCSLLFGYHQPEQLPEAVREQARVAGEAMSKVFDELVSSQTMEGLLNTTSKLRGIIDLQSERIWGATRGFPGLGLLPNKTMPFGVTDLLGTWGVPFQRQEGAERVGVRMARMGYFVNSPVVMIPGIITTGLEVWDGEDCIKSYFRQRIWGTATMFQSILRDPDCWRRHLALNASTGLDPLQSPHFNKSVRVRPAQGFESADFFLGGYWLWGLMIEALADIGYDLNSMHMASYDWRLSFRDMERRDRYFTRLRQQIETLVSMNRKKAVVVMHSMGGNVWHYFMQWATYRVHKNWVNDHIYAEVYISAPMLGLPKAYYSLLTGDNRDTVGGGFYAVLNHFFSAMMRRKLWRTWSTLALIMPIGGDTVWGEAMIGQPLVRLGYRNLTVAEAYDLLAKEGSVPNDLERISQWLLDGLRRSRPEAFHPSDSSHEPPERFWANPLVSPLPFAPNMRKYAFYGVGVPTDIMGFVTETGDDVEHPRYTIDTSASKQSGFYHGDGDYSVPVLSLGLMCIKGWQDERRNAARIPCTIKEYEDKPRTLLSGGSIRGGPSSGDHIDLLGNEEALADVLRVASGAEVEERIVSHIRAVADRWNDT